MDSEMMVQEVRQGLFCIYWNLKNLEQKVGFIASKAVRLCGSQTEKMYIITYKLKKNTDDYMKLKKKLQFAYSVTVEETTSVEKNAVEVLHSSPSPLYIWVKSKLAKDTKLEKRNSVKWILNRKTKTPKEFFTLYIDYGTITSSETKLIEGFKKMFYTQNNCDVEFQLNDGKTIGAHSNVLSIGSPVFAAMFQSQMIESETRKVVITDFDLEVFQQLLIHFYTGDAPKLEEENITQLLYEAADKYGVESLKEECIKVISKRINTSNAIEVLVWADFHSLSKLLESAVIFMVENCREICFKPDWLYLIKNHPELCMLVTQSMSTLGPTSTETHTE